jgi:hypothetical protein
VQASVSAPVTGGGGRTNNGQPMTRIFVPIVISIDALVI